MVVAWVDCCRCNIFTIALGTTFYGEKVNISICSEAAVSKGNRRFLASPETEISVSDCLCTFNK